MLNDTMPMLCLELCIKNIEANNIKNTDEVLYSDTYNLGRYWLYKVRFIWNFFQPPNTNCHRRNIDSSVF